MVEAECDESDSNGASDEEQEDSNLEFLDDFIAEDDDYNSQPFPKPIDNMRYPRGLGNIIKNWEQRYNLKRKRDA